MIKIFRARNADDAIRLAAPHFTFFHDAAQSAFVAELAQWMVAAPDLVFFLIALDGSELRGFIIGLDRGARTPYAEVAQVWSHPDNPPEVADFLFRRMVLWALSNGKKAIRGETARDLEAVYRRSGFTPGATVVWYELDEDMLDEVVRHSKGVF